MKQVLVTGGAHRLGAAIVRQFAAAGWRVWCHYQRSETAARALQTELQATGAQVELVAADLGQAHEVEHTGLLAFQVRGHGDPGAHRDHTGAAHSGDEDSIGLGG